MISVRVDQFAASSQPQAFPLQGSKRSQVPVISRLVPEGVDRIVEPFCGSAAVSVGLLHMGKVKKALLGDKNEEIVRLWSAIIGNPGDLVDEYVKIWRGQSRDDLVARQQYYLDIRDSFNRGERSHSAVFLFLLNKMVKGALRYNQNGEMNQSADRRRMGARPEVVADRIRRTHALLKGSEVRCADWNEVVAQAERGDVVYLDPPYQGTSTGRDKRYVAGLSVDDFELGLRRLVQRRISFIASYDAVAGDKDYGRPLDPSIGLTCIDVVTGVSAQGVLAGDKFEAHESLYLSPAIVSRLGGVTGVLARLATRDQQLLFG